MKYNPVSEENRIYVSIHSITKNSYKFLEYPGFSSIFAENADDLQTSLFITGVGIVEKAGESSGYKAGQHIAFFGYCCSNVDDKIVTSQNSVAYIPKSVSLEDAAYCVTFLPFVSITKATQLKLGENVIVSGNSEYSEKLKYVIELFGCNIVDENSMGYVDTVILFGNKNYKTYSSRFSHGTKFFLIPDSDNDSEGAAIPENAKVIKHIGKGYYDKDFQLSNTIYPYGYVRDTLKHDVEFCLEIKSKGRLLRQKLEKYDNVQGPIREINQGSTVYVFSYIKKIAELYVGHIEPGLLNITCFCDKPDMNLIEDFLREVTFIFNSRVTHIEFSGYIDKNHSIAFTFRDGSVAIINTITGFKVLSKKYQLNWDGQSAIYTSDGKIIYYTNKIQEVLVDDTAKNEVTLQYEDNIKKWKQYYHDLLLKE